MGSTIRSRLPVIELRLVLMVVQDSGQLVQGPVWAHTAGAHVAPRGPTRTRRRASCTRPGAFLAFPLFLPFHSFEQSCIEIYYIYI